MENINNLQDKRIVLISSYCDTKEKIDILINTIKTIKSHNLDVMVNSPLPLPSDVINMCTNKRKSITLLAPKICYVMGKKYG